MVLKGYSSQTTSYHFLTILTSCFLPLTLLGIFLPVGLLFKTVLQNHLLWVAIQLDCVSWCIPQLRHITLWFGLSACLSNWIVMSSKKDIVLFILNCPSFSEWNDWHVIVLNKVLLNVELFVYLQKKV